MKDMCIRLSLDLDPAIPRLFINVTISLVFRSPLQEHDCAQERDRIQG